MSVLNRGLLRDLIRIKQSLTRIRTETKTLLRDLNIPRLSLDQRELVKSVWGDIPQISNCPLFGDYTNEMIREVFSNRKNKIIAKLI